MSTGCARHGDYRVDYSHRSNRDDFEYQGIAYSSYYTVMSTTVENEANATGENGATSLSFA
ncbi:MAG: hypothetical protein BGN98_00600 [Microbacterium sp. 69-7]|nr:MAG: hypothetical protein BGN98_00600 [Microbacterium sp. 69-7]OJX67199.1 MAG: hypothetical protein BGO95_11275 [Micrococcales bacterium 73-13]